MLLYQHGALLHLNYQSLFYVLVVAVEVELNWQCQMGLVASFVLSHAVAQLAHY